MFIVTGLFRIDPADGGAFRDAALVMMAETEKEDGCIVYRFHEDIGDPGLYRVYEEWESEAHLKAHAETAHMKEFRAALGSLELKSRDVKMVTVTGEKKPA